MVAACIALFVTFFVQKLLQGNVDILGIVITGPVRGEGGDPVALNKQVGTAEHGYPCSVLFHDLLFQRGVLGQAFGVVHNAAGGSNTAHSVGVKVVQAAHIALFGG